LDSSSKQQQHQTLINGPSGDSGKIYAQLNGSMGSTSASSFNGSIGSQNSSTMVNAIHNGHSDISIDKQRNANISQHNSNKYQCGRWYVADFGPTAQRQQQNYTQHELDHNLEHSNLNNSLNIVKLPLNQTQTHFNPIESTTLMNQQHVFQSNSSQTLVQPTPTIINKTSSTTITTTNTTSLNSTNNNNNNLDNTNNGIPQQLHQSLVSNSSNNLSSIQSQQQQVRFVIFFDLSLMKLEKFFRL
jgi:hypothetical protein